MRILLVSALRDEAPYVVEWVAHHAALGVTDFLLYTNECSDGTDRLLQALAPAGVVQQDNVPPPGKSVQWHALRSAWAHPLRKVADWVMCIDSDEFVNLRAPRTTLPELIATAGSADAILLPWRLFGHNGQVRLTDGLTTELFDRAAPAACTYPIAHRQFKTLFRARGPFRQIGVHRPRQKSGAQAVWVDGSGQVMPARFAGVEQRISLFGYPDARDLVQLNHYSLRSAQSFILKQRRGLPNRKRKQIDMAYWVERNFNTVEDRSIAHLLPATRAKREELLRLPEVAALHRAGLAHHHAAFDAAMQDEAVVRLFGRLLLVASSTPLADPVIADLVTRYQQVSRDG